MNTDHRPVYIDLRKINLPVSALISITHRISGMYVFFVTLPVALCLIYFSTKNVNTFNSLVNFLNGNLVLKIVIIFSFCVLWYHILSGVRHLIMDAHIGESLTASHYSAIFTISFWVLSSSYIFWSLLA
ncbi:MAG: succinate dehydrogenase, cytochrome b556 subunit [Gammaproteobacteria bacterium]|nr:succinate dehydrogenase, cytochrome b556 subunit [Gammaproteobacteria bacterium]|tara:strand:+ start:340 stop:726 length:387 start_codon:yes stop_codon:yes gene_type:complete